VSYHPEALFGGYSLAKDSSLLLKFAAILIVCGSVWYFPWWLLLVLLAAAAVMGRHHVTEDRIRQAQGGFFARFGGHQAADFRQIRGLRHKRRGSSSGSSSSSNSEGSGGGSSGPPGTAGSAAGAEDGCIPFFFEIHSGAWPLTVTVFLSLFLSPPSVGKKRISSVLTLVAKIKPILGQATDQLVADLEPFKGLDPARVKAQDFPPSSLWKFVCYEKGILVLRNTTLSAPLIRFPFFFSFLFFVK